MHHNYGVTFNFFQDDTTAITQFKSAHENGFLNKQACFGNYHLSYKDSRTFYLEIPCVKWIDKCVEQFNREFKHVKITILDSKKLVTKITTDRYGGLVNSISYVEEGEDFDHQIVLIKFKALGRYSNFSRYVLFKMLGIVFRAFSITEGVTKLDTAEPENVFEYLNHVNNKYQGYGHTILDYKSGNCKQLSKELILLLDNIKLMNRAFKNPVKLGYSSMTFTLCLTQHFYQTPVWNYLYQTSLEEK